MSDMYRDPEYGAVAKRRDLLERRRDELVTLPHAVRRVVVTRWARIVASIAAWFGAEVMVIAAVAPPVADWISGALPGKEPAPLSTLLLAAWALALLGYFIARSAAEHRFAVAMSRTVLPGDDVFDDLERLDHVHPDHLARGMAHKLEVLSSALPVVAAATIVPATVAYIAMGVDARGWPSERAYEGWIVDHATGLAWLAVVGLVAAIAVTRRVLRLPTVTPIAALIAIVCAGLGLVSWLFVGPAAIAATLAVIVRRLQVERDRIQEEDPAAGSEVFTLRGMIREVRAALGTCRAFVRWHRRTFAIATVAACAVAVGALGVKMIASSRSVEPAEAVAPAITVTPIALQNVPAVPVSKSGSTYRIEPAPCDRMPASRGDCLRLELDFHGLEGIDVPTVFPGMTAIPVGWHAELRAQFVTVGYSDGVQMIAFPVGDSVFDQSPQWLDRYHLNASVEASSCGKRAVPASLRIRPNSNGGLEQRVTLLLNPTLEPTSCDGGNRQ